MYVFFNFVENQLAVDALVYFGILYFVLLIYVSVFMPIPYSFCYYGSLVYFEMRYCDISSILFYCSKLLWLKQHFNSIWVLANVYTHTKDHHYQYLENFQDPPNFTFAPLQLRISFKYYQPLNCFLSLQICFAFSEVHLNGIIQHVLFGGRLFFP